MRDGSFCNTPFNYRIFYFVFAAAVLIATVIFSMCFDRVAEILPNMVQGRNMPIGFAYAEAVRPYLYGIPPLFVIAGLISPKYRLLHNALTLSIAASVVLLLFCFCYLLLTTPMIMMYGPVGL